MDQVQPCKSLLCFSSLPFPLSPVSAGSIPPSSRDPNDISGSMWTELMTSYFATYELLKMKLSPPAPIIPGTGEKAAAPPLSIGAVMLAGGTAGVAMWSVAIPPDVSWGDPEEIAHGGSSALVSNRELTM